MQSEKSGATSRRKARRHAPPAAIKVLSEYLSGPDLFALPEEVTLASAAKAAAAGAALAALAGCGATDTGQNTDLERNRSEAQNLLAGVGMPVSSRQPGPAAKTPPRQGADFSTNRISLPKRLTESSAVRYASAGPVTLAEALSRLSDLAGIPHVLRTGTDGKLLPNGPTGGAAQLAASGLDHPIHADFSGSLPEILDQIAGRFGLAWRFERGRIVLRQYVTGRYRLAALPAQSAFSSSVGNTSSSGSIDLPGEIISALTMIAGDEALVSYGEASGILTAVARPAAQRRIAEYVRELNEFLSKQVAFDVNVLSVTNRRTEQSGLDFDLFAGSPEGSSVRWSANQPQASGGSVNVGIISGNFDLRFLLTALDRHGDVSVETRTGATTSNNQIVPIQVVNETAYAKSIKSVTGSGGESGTTIEPATLTTGFEMLLLPRILPSGDILLRYSVKLSDLNDLVEFTSDKQTIQLPRLSTTSFEQQAILGNEEILVLMGFERDRKSLSRPGSSIHAGLSGFRRSAETERISTVLTIRPRIAQAHRQSAHD